MADIPWAKAMHDAKIIMGKTSVSHGRSHRKVWAAEEDPLAHWCLVELLVSHWEHTVIQRSGEAIEGDFER